jgi:hypothetical protein
MSDSLENSSSEFCKRSPEQLDMSFFDANGGIVAKRFYLARWLAHLESASEIPGFNPLVL